MWTGRPIWRDITRFRGELPGINCVLGVATGLMRYFAGILGLGLAVSVAIRKRFWHESHSYPARRRTVHDGARRGVWLSTRKA